MELEVLKPQVDKLKWIVEKAVHTYSMGGLVTQLDLEANI